MFSVRAMEDIKAKKSLGQNFLKDEKVLKLISDSFSYTKDDLIIEIGPGKGALTKYLIQKPSSFLCYELDDRMKDLLVAFKSENCEIIFDDFLKRDIKQDIKKDYKNIYVIANIPYYITTPIITHILESGIPLSGMSLLVQKEVAERFVSLPKSREYGYFTVLLQHYFTMEKVLDVPPKSFNPMPKVMSSVVKFTRKENKYNLDIVLFQDFLKQAFSQKRKTLKNNLKSYHWNIIEPLLLKLGYADTARAEEITYEDFVTIFLKLQEN